MNSIPTVTKNLLIINLLAFAADFVLRSYNIDLTSILGLHFFMASKFHIYQLFTYMFMHGSLQHIFFNMFALWMFGCIIERTWGPKKFLFYYILCGIGAGLIQEIVQYFSITWELSNQNDGVTISTLLTEAWKDSHLADSLNVFTTVGASGAIYAILLAFGMTFPEERIFIFPLPIPIKAKWFVIGYAAIELGLALSNSGDGVAHVAHLGGMLFGFFLIRHWRKSEHRQTSFTGWDSYQGSQSQGKSATILGKIRKWMHLDREDDGYNKDPHFRSTSTHQADWDYNAQKKRDEAEIDAILDKIRRSGYASLSAEEKKKLFDASKN